MSITEQTPYSVRDIQAIVDRKLSYNVYLQHEEQKLRKRLLRYTHCGSFFWTTVETPTGVIGKRDRRPCSTPGCPRCGAYESRDFINQYAERIKLAYPVNEDKTIPNVNIIVIRSTLPLKEFKPIIEKTMRRRILKQITEHTFGFIERTHIGTNAYVFVRDCDSSLYTDFITAAESYSPQLDGYVKPCTDDTGSHSIFEVSWQLRQYLDQDIYRILDYGTREQAIAVAIADVGFKRMFTGHGFIDPPQKKNPEDEEKIEEPKILKERDDKDEKKAEDFPSSQPLIVAGVEFRPQQNIFFWKKLLSTGRASVIFDSNNDEFMWFPANPGDIPYGYSEIKAKDVKELQC